MKNFTTVSKSLVVATVIGALGLAYAQTNSTATVTDKDTVTGTTTRQSDIRTDGSMGTQSNTTSGRMSNGSNSNTNSMGTGANTGNGTSGSANDTNTSGMNGERTARADRN